jgi:hypothetical protein
MTDLDTILKSLKPSTSPTLKDRIRAHMPAIEEARANRVKWKTIRHNLEAAGIVIDQQLLANYICELRKETRPPKATVPAENLPVKPAALPAPNQVRDGTDELPRHVAGGLLAPPLLQ